MSGPPVPTEWTRIVATLETARRERQDMKNRDLPQAARDHATIAYTCMVDAIIDDLAALSHAHELGRITLLLARKERR